MEEKQKNKKISIVTVTYNAGKTIDKTIQSVINQTYNNIEYIIIDGRSTDNTLSIIEKYCSKISILVSEKDNGIYDAMNKALDIANGDYIFFIGADDIFYNNYVIENVVKSIKNEDEIYYGDVYMPEHHKTYWGKVGKIKLGIGNICHQSIFYPRIVYKNYYYNLNYKIFADYVYNLNLYNKVKFNYIGQIIAIFNVLGASQYKEDSNFGYIKNHLIIKELGYTSLIISYIYHFLRKTKNRIRGVYYR